MKADLLTPAMYLSTLSTSILTIQSWYDLDCSLFTGISGQHSSPLLHPPKWLRCQLLFLSQTRAGDPWPIPWRIMITCSTSWATFSTSCFILPCRTLARVMRYFAMCMTECFKNTFSSWQNCFKNSPSTPRRPGIHWQQQILGLKKIETGQWKWNQPSSINSHNEIWICTTYHYLW